MVTNNNKTIASIAEAALCYADCSKWWILTHSWVIHWVTKVCKELLRQQIRLILSHLEPLKTVVELIWNSVCVIDFEIISFLCIKHLFLPLHRWKKIVFTHLNVDDVVHRYEDIQSWKNHKIMVHFVAIVLMPTMFFFPIMVVTISSTPLCPSPSCPSPSCPPQTFFPGKLLILPLPLRLLRGTVIGGRWAENQFRSVKKKYQ